MTSRTNLSSCLIWGDMGRYGEIWGDDEPDELVLAPLLARAGRAGVGRLGDEEVGPERRDGGGPEVAVGGGVEVARVHDRVARGLGVHHHGAEDMAGVVGREREAAGRADTLVQRDDLVPYLKSLESTVGSVSWVVR